MKTLDELTEDERIFCLALAKHETKTKMDPSIWRPVQNRLVELGVLKDPGGAANYVFPQYIEDCAEQMFKLMKDSE